MHSIAVEYLRFGDDAGIARLSERYLCTVQSGELTTLQLNLTQAKLREAMRRLDYVNYRRGKADEVREEAESVLRQLLPRLQAFLPKVLAEAHGERRQVEIVTQALELAAKGDVPTVEAEARFNLAGVQYDLNDLPAAEADAGRAGLAGH